MATSSITETIRVNNPKLLEEYIDYMEKSLNDYRPRTESEITGVVADKKRIQALAAKALAKKGIRT